MKNKMIISIIVAMSENRVIGRNNQLPWHLPGDLKHFKSVTWGKPILMGRLTYESIGRPLPGRTNIVLTHDPSYMAPGCVVVNSFEHAMNAAKGFDELMVIGGARVFEKMLPMADRLYLTQIHATVEGDTFFPEWESNQWVACEKNHFSANDHQRYAYSIYKYEKEELGKT